MELQKEKSASRWLTVGEASDLLTISPSTLRRWTEKRLVPVHKTAGGHRRYNRQAIEEVAHTLNSIRATETTLARQPSALLSANWGITQERLKAQRWYPRFARPETALAMRALGQRLLGMLIQHISRGEEDSRFLQEAHEVGVTHGRLSAATGATFQELVDAFLFFRKSFSRVVLQVPRIAHSSDGEEVVRLAHLTDEFMNAVLSGMAEGFESTSAGQPSPKSRTSARSR